MGIGMSKVVEGLYLGSISDKFFQYFILGDVDAEDKETLTKHGITHILSVHNNAKPLLEGMTYLCISASDSSNQNFFEFSPPFLNFEFNIFRTFEAKDGSVFATIFSCELNIPSEKNFFGIQHFKECISFIHECRLHGGCCLIHCLAGVSRSTTILVAYLMTVTHFGWKECLAAAKAVRSYVSPNFGFQKQLQEYEATLLQEYRTWVQMEYGKNPLPDQEELQRLLSPKEEKVNEPQIGLGETKWNGAPSPDNHEPHTRYGDSSNSGHHQGTNR